MGYILVDTTLKCGKSQMYVLESGITNTYITTDTLQSVSCAVQLDPYLLMGYS